MSNSLKSNAAHPSYSPGDSLSNIERFLNYLYADVLEAEGRILKFRREIKDEKSFRKRVWSNQSKTHISGYPSNNPPFLAINLPCFGTTRKQEGGLLQGSPLTLHLIPSKNVDR